MKKKRLASPVHQIMEILKNKIGVGESKLESRNNSNIISENGHKVSDKIHSYKSFENSKNDLINLAQFSHKEMGQKDFSKINKSIVKNWIKNKDISYSTASNYLSNINKVIDNLDITKEEIKEIRAEIKAENIVKSSNNKDSRAYRNLDKITLPDKFQSAFELQRDYGLRVSATITINISKQIKNNIFTYREKGGKWSSRELKEELINKIKYNSTNGIYKIENRTYSNYLKKEIESTGQEYNGTHGIRHTYAQNQLSNGKTKAQVSQEMGHIREEITDTYLR